MSENVQYLFTNETPDGALVFRSKINSFGLDHATDKDMYSFYTNFSSRAYFDTGLLPVEGSGLLAIRSALNHTQVAYQHAPGKYYINWGQHEGDSRANKYYVAQPYRVVIIDFVNGNILGARTFYSPVPITHPGASLYHTNLPNINCRGYRNNGVGWICLYHSEDISEYPFNEKLFKALERCSGVETYNDANMNETDGTRFYQEYREAYPYLWDPKQWEAKTERDGVDWTLDPDMWLEVLVRGLDDQGAHDWDGQPLTFADALFGDYRAYYSDDLVPKPVNAIARRDKDLNRQALFNEFKQAYMNSSNSNMPFQAIDVFNMSAKIKQELSVSFDSPQNSKQHIECVHCGESYEVDDVEESEDVFWVSYSEDWSCASCYETQYVFSQTLDLPVPCWSMEATAVFQEMRNKPAVCMSGHDCNESFVLHDIRANSSQLNHPFLDLRDLESNISTMLLGGDLDHKLTIRVQLPFEIRQDLQSFYNRFPDQKIFGPYVKNLLDSLDDDWFKDYPNCQAHLTLDAVCLQCVQHILEDDSAIRFLVFTDRLKSMFAKIIYKCSDEMWEETHPTSQDMITRLVSCDNVHARLG